MTDLEADISGLYEEMTRFLRLQARQEETKNAPLTLRTEYKTSLKLTDSEKQVFEVDESFLSNFRDTYTDKACIFGPTQTRQSGSTTGNSRSDSSENAANASISSPNQSLSWPPKQPRKKSPPVTSKCPSLRQKSHLPSFPLKYRDTSTASVNETFANSPTTSTKK